MTHLQANFEDKPVGEYLFPSLDKVGSPILIPTIQADQWKINPSLIQMISNNAFIGEQNPYSHLTFFLELCSTFKLLNVPNEVIYLTLFPFSLMGRAKKWLYSHEPNTFTSWEELANAFLLHFFPPALTKNFKQQIRLFEQDEDESFYETYARFKELLHSCPHHNLPKWELLQSFYDGLIPSEKSHLDLSSGGAFMDLTINKSFEMLEKIARNSYLWGGKKESKRRNQGEISREEELFCVYEDKPFESSFYASNQASNDLYDDEDNLELEEDATMLQIKESSIGKEFEVVVDSQPLLSNQRYESLESNHCRDDIQILNSFEYGDFTLFENTLFELEDFNLHENESFEHDVVYVDDDPLIDCPLIDNPLFEHEKFTLYDNGLFENDSLCLDDATPFKSLVSFHEESRYETLKPCYTLHIIVRFRFNDSPLMHDQSLKLVHVPKMIKKDVSYVIDNLNGHSSQIYCVTNDLRGRSPQMLFLKEVRPRLDGREYTWDLKVA